MIFLSITLLCACLTLCCVAFFERRNILVYEARKRAIKVIFGVPGEWHRYDHYLDPSTYNKDIFQFSNKTFEDFFPELAAIEAERKLK